MESAEAVVTALSGTETTFHPDLCPGVSRTLVEAITDRLQTGLALSVGCGSGLLESMILLTLHQRDSDAGPVTLVGIEVPDCAVTYLPPQHIERVQNTFSLSDDCVLASTLLFVYPRQADLIAMYLDATVNAALEQVIWLGHRNDLQEIEPLLLAAFYKVEHVQSAGTAPSEVLIVASMPRRREPKD
jgi:hypothetical protein